MANATAPHRIVDQITTSTDKKFEQVARMADAIIDAWLENGNCLPQDLKAKGFTHQDVTTLWHFANALAFIELKQLEAWS
jgi:3-methyladenine DNA glycosylase Tag